MLNLYNATKEKEDILNQPEKDSSRMYFRNIFRYVNITEYQSLVDNVKFFLEICPKSMDGSKNVEYWRYLKSYLKGVRYFDNDLNQKVEAEEKIVLGFSTSNTKNFYEEIRRFLEKVFIPTWLSKWEKK